MVTSLFGALVVQATIVVAPHFTTLTWNDTQTNVSWNVYKGIGSCASNPSFTKIANVANKTHRDDNVISKQTACYYVTAFDGKQESAPSSKAEGTTP
jgi:hypothetical protein